MEGVLELGVDIAQVRAARTHSGCCQWPPAWCWLLLGFSLLDSPHQLLCGQEEDEFIVEGLLNISWGLRRPIRLQMQDDNERIRPPPSSSSWHSGCNLGAQG